MPVSHLGLSVSHIPSATSFYLAALQPLGYHFIGHQGDSIGLGIRDADFFLTQEPTGARPWPTHIAFAATSRLEVRECYAAALNAGGRPSGAPSYRNTDCTCFNAAVCDLDGNTIEIIFREGEDGGFVEEESIGPSEHSRVLTWQQGVARGSIDDAVSVDNKASKAQSRGRTVRDIASQVSKSTKRSSSAAPAVNRNEGASFQGIPVNTIIGTALGAAAGAAAIFAMCSSERENARDEAAHLDAASRKGSSRAYERQTTGIERPSRKTIEAPPVSILKNRRNLNVTDTLPSRPPPRRNFSVTESAYSTRRPLQPSMRTIAPGGYDDDEVQDVLSRYTLARPKPRRAATYDAIEYGPRQSSYEPRATREAIEYAPVNASSRGSRYQAKRSTTLPDKVPQLYIEGPRSTASRRDDHRGSYEERERERELKRHDSGVSMRSHRSKHDSDAGKRSSRSEAGSKTSTIKPSRRDKYESAAGVPLPASRAESQASTLKPSRRDYYDSAAGVPIPASRAESKTSKHESRHQSRRDSAAHIPLPSSHHSDSRYTAAQYPLPASTRAPSSYVSAAQVPVPRSMTGSAWYEEPPEDLRNDSDGMDDMKTVVPDDSISCVDFSSKASRSSRRKESDSGRSKHASSRRGDFRDGGDRERRSEASTVKPSKSRGSAVTLPVRERRVDEREKGRKRSVFSYT